MKDLGKKAERGKSAKDRDLRVPTGKGWEDEGRSKLDTIRLRKAEKIESKGIIFKRNRVVKMSKIKEGLRRMRHQLTH